MQAGYVQKSIYNLINKEHNCFAPIISINQHPMGRAKKTIIEKKIPDDFKYYYGGDIMTNLDGSIDRETEKKIKGKKLYASYPAWNFYGGVWWEANQWHCAVKQYHHFMGTLSADTLEELMEEVSDKYGYE